MNMYKEPIFLCYVDDVGGNITIPQPARQCSVLSFGVNYIPPAIIAITTLTRVYIVS